MVADIEVDKVAGLRDYWFYVIFPSRQWKEKTSHSHFRKIVKQLSEGLCAEYKVISDIPQENIVNTKSSFYLFICSISNLLLRSFWKFKLSQTVQCHDDDQDILLCEWQLWKSVCLYLCFCVSVFFYLYFCTCNLIIMIIIGHRDVLLCEWQLWKPATKNHQTTFFSFLMFLGIHIIIIIIIIIIITINMMIISCKYYITRVLFCWDTYMGYLSITSEVLQMNSPI